MTELEAILAENDRLKRRERIAAIRNWIDGFLVAAVLGAWAPIIREWLR